jgi:ABC-type branched-subunit amino acid transport system permease subunit
MVLLPRESKGDPMTINLALRIASIVCFLLVAFGVSTVGGVVGLLALGLALFAGSFIP